MDRIREQFNKPIVIAIVGGIVGLVLGLVIGWGIWPVQWYDAAVVHLRQDLQDDYLRMAIDSFARNNNQELAVKRFQELGDDANDTLARVQMDLGSVKPGDVAKFSTAVQSGVTVQLPTQPQQQGATPAEGQPTLAVTQAPAVVEPPATPANRSNLTIILAVLCLLTLVVGGAAAYMFLFRKNKRPGFLSPAAQAQEANRHAQRTEFAAQGAEIPVAQYMTSYVAGDNLYDESFSIDAPSGDFLGECGVGISDTIGVGDPKKVTAFEVWLFDKNDIQTITKVLMSDYAFNDPAARQRLASKGEPVLVEPGQHIRLETATLVLEARVVDMAYGQGALPDDSYFDRMTLELAIWPKPVA